MVIANGSNQIYLSCGLKNFSTFGQSQFYLANAVNRTWFDKFEKELKKSRWLVIQTDDIHPSITGQFKSSFEILQNHRSVYHYIAQNFKKIKVIENYIIFRKN